MPARTFSLSLAAVDILSQALDVNPRQFPFEIPSVGQFQDDRLRLAKVVFKDLTKNGLVRRGQVDGDLERAMHVLSDWVIAVAAMGTLEKDKPIFARASAAGDVGVLAVIEGQRMRLEMIRPTALAVTMVGLLPKADAGPGQSVTISRPAPTGGRRTDDREQSLFQAVRAPSSGSEQQLRIAEGYLQRPRTGAGFFVVSGRGRHGREVRAGDVGWFDTDAGRYLSLSRPVGEDGQTRVTYSPADAGRLAQALGGLIESAAERR